MFYHHMLSGKSSLKTTWLCCPNWASLNKLHYLSEPVVATSPTLLWRASISLNKVASTIDGKEEYSHSNGYHSVGGG